MPSLDIELHIDADRLLEYYRGRARTVHATASNGQTVNFPASALQAHVTADGIHGWFRLEFDEHYKLLRLEKREDGPALDCTA
jgi:hypothetical protein